MCRPKRGIGGICEDNDSCRDGLRCDVFQMSFQQQCFDPSLSLHVGNVCNPNPGIHEPRCTAERMKWVDDLRPTACLPKNTSYVCQWPVGLFEKCSPKDNVVCFPNDLVCNKFGVCVPMYQL